MTEWCENNDIKYMARNTGTNRQACSLKLSNNRSLSCI